MWEAFNPVSGVTVGFSRTLSGINMILDKYADDGIFLDYDWTPCRKGEPEEALA